MLTTSKQRKVESVEVAELEFYKLIEEGYKAVQDGRISTMEEVRERFQQRREVRG